MIDVYRYLKTRNKYSVASTAGSGQHTKMCNQIAIASNMIGVCEAVAYAKRLD